MSARRNRPMPSLDPTAFALVAVAQPDPVGVAIGTDDPGASSGAARPRRSPIQASRRGKVQLNVWVLPEVRARLKHISADTGRTVEELVASAIDGSLARWRDTKI